MDELNRRYAIRPAARLALSERVSQVLSFGHFKPLILLPVGLLNQLTPVEVEAILLHELAHLQRRDYLWNWLQSAVETIFFFHPAVYWLGNRIRHERECCCDDWVAQRADKTIYAQSLINLARFAQTPINQLAMYANSSRSPLGRRIERLFVPPARRRSVLPLLLLLLPFVLLAWRPVPPEAIGSVPAAPTVVEPVLDSAPPVAVLNQGESTLAAIAPAGSAAPADVRFRPAALAVTPLSPLLPSLLRLEADTVRPEPLYVIDGVALPLGQGPADLEPKDIESITVWKGAEATARYGAQGANGVVEITTKAGDRPAPTDSPQFKSDSGSTVIRIRATDEERPLFIIDGQRHPDPAAPPAHLTPENIESTKVLKGDAAVERYGEDAKHGAVVIGTKTGVVVEGRRAGAPVDPGAGETIRLGHTKLSQDSLPLFVIDGEPLPRGSSSLEEIDPNQIDRINVLKGAAATEAYGAEGEHGVVEIFLKGTPAPEFRVKRRAARRAEPTPQPASRGLRFGPGITTGDPNPLYVIDGEIQPDDSALERLDKSNIDRINVLKGEAAQTAYGAAAGDRTVIEIYLKKAPAPAPQPAGEVEQLAGTLYPNPTTGQTQVRFQLKSEEQVVLAVFNAAGQQVLSRQIGRRSAGEQLVEFDATSLPPGNYTVTILAGSARWQTAFVRP
jgi:TonB-dependent SusC/RagA subfamily outer membrane receptor